MKIYFVYKKNVCMCVKKKKKKKKKDKGDLK